MKILFIALCLSVVLSILLAYFTSNFEYKTKLKKYILKYVLRTVAFIYLFSIFVCLIFLHPLLGLFYIFACSGILIFIIGLYKSIYGDYYEALLFSLLGVIIGMLFSFEILISNFNDSVNEISKEEIVFNDFSLDSKNTSEKIIIIKLSENENNSNLFTVKTYNSDIKLPLYLDVKNNYEIVKDGKTKIIITTYEETSIDLLAYFEFKKPDISKSQTTYLYINSEDIWYN